MMYTEGNVWLVMEGVEPEKMLPQGTGYWSPLLGAAPGAKITVSLKMRGKNLRLLGQGLAGRVAAIHQRNRAEPPAGVPRRQG